MHDINCLNDVISSYNWDAIRNFEGFANDTPSEILRLITAQSESESESIYDYLNNRSFIQESLFESAVSCTHLICEIIKNYTISPNASIVALELLLEFARGVPDKESVARGNSDIAVRCKEIIRIYLQYIDRASKNDETGKYFYYILYHLGLDPNMT